MPKPIRNAAMWLARRIPLGPLGPWVLTLAIGSPFPHRKPRPLRWLAIGLVRLMRGAQRELIGLYPNRLLRATQRLQEAGDKLEAAVRILLTEGWRL